MFDRRLYDQTTDTVRNALAASGAAEVLVIGRNPTMAALADDLSRPAPDHAKFARYPTGVATVLRFEADVWAEIALGTPLAFAVPGDLSGRGSG
jgi:phosphohistidine phosphatase